MLQDLILAFKVEARKNPALLILPTEILSPPHTAVAFFFLFPPLETLSATSTKQSVGGLAPSTQGTLSVEAT